MYKKVLMVCMVMVAFLMSIYACPETSYAKDKMSKTQYEKCREEAKYNDNGDKNRSMVQACDDCYYDDKGGAYWGPWGAVWFTNASNEVEGGDALKDDVIKTNGEETVEIEARGLYNQCRYYKDTDYSNKIPTIHIVISKDRNEYVDESAAMGFSINLDSTLRRGKVENNLQYEWSKWQDLDSEKIKGTLDVAKFRKWAVSKGYGECADEKNDCEVTTWIYRKVKSKSAKTGWSEFTIKVTGEDVEEEKEYTCADVGETFSGDTTQVSSWVKNTTLNTGWAKSVYAKPGDKIAWTHCYYSGVQSKANTMVSDELEHDDSGGDYYSYTELYKKIGNWGNWYMIKPSEDSSIDFNGGKFTIGEVGIHKNENSEYSPIEGEKVGQEITEVITTSYPSAVTITNEGDYIGYDPIGEVSDEASVIVPYNYKNRTVIEKEEEGSNNEIAYAGETIEVNITLKNLPKENIATEGYYATKSETKYKVIVCYGDDYVQPAKTNHNDEGERINVGTCKESKVTEGIVLNEASNRDGDDLDETKTINVPDAKAGTHMCVQSAIYAQDSGADNNWTDINGNGEWSYSPTAVCYTIAKKPSLQVWGGNVYSKNGIVTSVAKKNNLNGNRETEYSVDGDSTEYIFGSWAELGVISNGTVKDFASGATTGYGSNINGVLTPNQAYGKTNQGEFGGTTEKSFCYRSILTFSNENCSIGSAGLIKTTTVYERVNEDKESIIQKLITDSSDSEGDKTISGKELSKDDGVKVEYATGNIYISGNITYEDDGYTDLTEVPKMVIYAKGNVYINCNVERIDALIMANGTVYTCANEDGTVPGIDTEERSNQLVVNGAIIAENLKADRTYGAATGSNSMVSAEIINFDPTLYLWAGNTDNAVDDDGNSVALPGDLETTYIHELAPRL